MKKIIPIITIIFLTMVSCHRSKNVTTEKNSVTIKDNNIASFNDMVFKDSSCLMMLIDTLFEHIENNGEKRSVKNQEEEKWMRSFHQRLCSHYNSLSLEKKLSNDAKVDTLLNYAERNIKNSADVTTAGMIRSNIHCSAIHICLEYRLLSELLNYCKDDKTKDLVYQECSLYVKMNTIMETLVTEITFLNYWGGSIAASLCTYYHKELSSARVAMYKMLIMNIKGESYDTGKKVNLDNAEHNLLEQIDRSIHDPVKSSEDWLKDLKEIDKESYLRYMETIRESEDNYVRFSFLIKEWIKQWIKMGDLIAKDSNKHYMEHIASKMLLDWTDITISMNSQNCSVSTQGQKNKYYD